MKQFLTGFTICFLFLYLLLFPQNGLYACTHALALWSDSVVPALFPVMILSRLLISTDILYFILKPIAFLFRSFFDLSFYGAYALLLGYVCGYPMGVKTIADLEDDRLISQEEGHFLARFINNVSPSFLVDYVCTELLRNSVAASACMVIIYGASLTYGAVTAIFRKNTGSRLSYTEKAIAEPDRSRKKSTRFSFLLLLDHTLEDSILQILKIGGYMVLFSVLSSVVYAVSFLPDEARATLSAVLEISCGAQQIALLSCPAFLRGILLTASISFGGLCSAFQSSAFLQRTGTSLPEYIKAKAMISLIALAYYLLYSNSVHL